MTNATGTNWQTAAVKAASQVPFAVLLGLVLWFVGNSLVDLGKDFLIVQRDVAAAVKEFSVAVNRIADEDMARGVAEREEHQESLKISQQFLALVQYVTTKRDVEIELLRELLRELREDRKSQRRE